MSAGSSASAMASASASAGEASKPPTSARTSRSSSASAKRRATIYDTCDVMVVGAGLAGLSLALQLGRDGVRTLVLDPRPSDSMAQASPAAQVGGGTLITPVTAQWATKVGVHAALLRAEGCRVVDDFVGLSSPALLTNGKLAKQKPRPEPDISTREGALVAELQHKKGLVGAQCGYLNLKQSELENVIRGECSKAKSVAIAWGQSFESVVEEAEDGTLSCEVADIATGESRVVSCRYLCGCDGRGSRVRETEFRGKVEGFDNKEHKGVMLHMMCECSLGWDLDRAAYRLEQKSLNGFGPTIGGGACEPVPGADPKAYRLSVNAPFTMWAGSADPSESPPLSLLQKQLKPKLPKGAEISDVSWSRFYRMNHFVASSFRRGSAILVGEAAHSHPPVGILPMNAAIADAADLAWKLSLAVRLGLRPSEGGILDSYEEERRAAAEDTRRSIAGYFSDLMQGKLDPVRYARNDCGLFSSLPEASQMVVRSDRAAAYPVRVGEIPPSVAGLLLTNTMTSKSFQDIACSSLRHKVFCFCSEWPVKMDSPFGGGESEPSHSGRLESSDRSDRSVGSEAGTSIKRRGSAEVMTWERILQNTEFMLGRAFVSQCDFYVLHQTSKIAHTVDLDRHLSCDPVHVVDAESRLFREWFGEDALLSDTGAARGLLLRPDGRVGCIGEFPDFLEDLGHYHHRSGLAGGG